MKSFRSTTAHTNPASRAFAGMLAVAIAAAVLAMLLSLCVPRGAYAQETTSGIDVGEDSVSINGGQVFAGDGCAKAGDVVVGDCEEGKAKKGDDPADGGDGSSGASEDGTGAEPSEDQYEGGDGSEDEAGESTVLESTVHESTTSGEGGDGTRSQTTETTTGSTTDVVEESGAGPEPDPAATGDPDEGCAVEGPMGETTTTTVERTIDGDTVETPEGAVRLIGVDTPETVDPGEPVEPGGEEASGFTASELEGEPVELEIGTEPEDDYGRTLAYLWTEDERGEPVLFNETLLREGMGELLIIPPNDEYERCLAAAEKAAQDGGVGLWAEDAGDAEPVPADSPPEPEISASGETYSSPEDAASDDAPTQDQYAGEAARPEDAETEDAAPSAAEDQYEEAASEPTQPAPTEEPEVQEPEVQDPEVQEEEIQEPEIREEGAREPRVRSSELADAPAESPAEVPVEASAELPADDASVPTTSAPPVPAGAAPITTLPETGGASVASLAAGTLLVCSGLLAARLARTPRRSGNAAKSERARR